MKVFTYLITRGQQLYDDPQDRQRFLSSKDDGYRGYETHHKPRQSKSSPQLGYYWGLLVPEITKALKELGWTVTMGKEPHTLERYYEHQDTHDWLKESCARIGQDGGYVTLSEQDLEECSKFIDNVLWVAENWLDMDRKKLEAKRPKGESK